MLQDIRDLFRLGGCGQWLLGVVTVVGSGVVLLEKGVVNRGGSAGWVWSIGVVVLSGCGQLVASLRS